MSLVWPAGLVYQWDMYTREWMSSCPVGEHSRDWGFTTFLNNGWQPPITGALSHKITPPLWEIVTIPLVAPGGRPLGQGDDAGITFISKLTNLVSPYGQVYSAFVLNFTCLTIQMNSKNFESRILESNSACISCFGSVKCNFVHPLYERGFVSLYISIISTPGVNSMFGMHTWPFSNAWVASRMSPMKAAKAKSSWSESFSWKSNVSLYPIIIPKTQEIPIKWRSPVEIENRLISKRTLKINRIQYFLPKDNIVYTANPFWKGAHLLLEDPALFSHFYKSCSSSWKSIETTKRKQIHKLRPTAASLWSGANQRRHLETNPPIRVQMLQVHYCWAQTPWPWRDRKRTRLSQTFSTLIFRVFKFP